MVQLAPLTILVGLWEQWRRAIPSRRWWLIQRSGAGAWVLGFLDGCLSGLPVGLRLDMGVQFPSLSEPKGLELWLASTLTL